MTNFLDLRCPRCHRDDGIDIQATLWIRVCEDGTDADASADGNHEYSPRSAAICAHCDYHGPLSSFEESTDLAAGPEGGAP